MLITHFESHWSFVFNFELQKYEYMLKYME